MATTKRGARLAREDHSTRDLARGQATCCKTFAVFHSLARRVTDRRVVRRMSRVCRVEQRRHAAGH